MLTKVKWKPLFFAHETHTKCALNILLIREMHSKLIWLFIRQRLKEMARDDSILTSAFTREEVIPSETPLSD